MKENPYNEIGEKLDKIISNGDSILSTLRLIAVLFCFILFTLLFIKGNKQIEDKLSSTTNEIQTTTESEVIE